MYRLMELGWNPFFENQRSPLDRPEWIPGRVVEEGRGLYRLIAEPGEGLAELAGKVRPSASGGERQPAVGDCLRGYHKLEREQEFLESRQDPAARAARLQKFKWLIREQRRFYNR